jgi:ribosomal protein S18 acetylase RimI-like enzyme
VSGKIEIREFLIDDYEAAFELWKRVGGLEICEGDEREDVAKFLACNPGLSQVAIGRTGIVGVALCGHDGRRGHIYHLAVDPAVQGGGVGQRLVNECMKGLRRAGLQRAIILVANDNPRGQKFWKQNGWEEIGGAIAMGKDVLEKEDLTCL